MRSRTDPTSDPPPTIEAERVASRIGSFPESPRAILRRMLSSDTFWERARARSFDISARRAGSVGASLIDIILENDRKTRFFRVLRRGIATAVPMAKGPRTGQSTDPATEIPRNAPMGSARDLGVRAAGR